jgi:methanogenic corrinoid protein MtbC1
MREKEVRMDTSFARSRVRFLLAILAGNRDAACRVVDAVRDEGADEDATVIDVMRPALYEVGVRWANHEISVGDEHLASATAAIALEHLAERTAPPRTGGEHPSALVSCVEGELHCLGARALALTLERHGWSTLYCGASTPVQDVVSLARQHGPRVVALSVARRALLGAAARTADELRGLDVAPVVIAGGQAFRRPEECPGADVVHVGPDFRPLVETLRESVR